MYALARRQAVLLIAALLCGFLPLFAQSHGGGGGLPGGGSFNASGAAPGGKDTADPDFGTQQTGALTVTAVSVGGQALTQGTHYIVLDQGTSQASVRFLAGSVPTAGQSVSVVGQTATSGSFNGTLNWS